MSLWPQCDCGWSWTNYVWLRFSKISKIVMRHRDLKYFSHSPWVCVSLPNRSKTILGLLVYTTACFGLLKKTWIKPLNWTASIRMKMLLLTIHKQFGLIQFVNYLSQFDIFGLVYGFFQPFYPIFVVWLQNAWLIIKLFLKFCRHINWPSNSICPNAGGLTSHLHHSLSHQQWNCTSILYQFRFFSRACNM